MSGTVLILGAGGKIGVHSAKAFADAGWSVKRYDRKQDDMATKAKGCDLIVNGLNPPSYHNWAEVIPAITQQVIKAARASGASVMIPGNVYHFGSTPGLWSETTPAKPVSRKGQIRLAMEAAYRDSGVQTIILRAGNFIDPHRNGCVMSTLYLRNLARGTFVLPGPADTRQAFCYLKDWARAAVGLAQIRRDLGVFEDIPFPGHTLTANQIRRELEELLARDLKMTPFPWWLMSTLSPVWELARELKEMRYLWQTDHALCGRRFGALLPGFAHTALRDVLIDYLND